MCSQLMKMLVLLSLVIIGLACNDPEVSKTHITSGTYISDPTSNTNNNNDPATTNNDPTNNSDPGGNNNTPVPEPNNSEETQVAIDSCAQAYQNNTIIRTEQVVNIPAQIECDWNVNGNLSRLNGKIRARRETAVDVEVQNVKFLCDLSIHSELQNMQYDDEIFLLFNDYVLFSTQNYGQGPIFPNGLSIEMGKFQRYKWEETNGNGLRNLDYDWNLAPPYCLGSNRANVVCEFPPTETAGSIQFIPDSVDIIELGVHSGIIGDNGIFNNQTPQLKYIVTGDNDNGDCESSAFSFTLKVDYVPVQ